MQRLFAKQFQIRRQTISYFTIHNPDITKAPNNIIETIIRIINKTYRKK